MGPSSRGNFCAETNITCLVNVSSGWQKAKVNIFRILGFSATNVHYVDPNMSRWRTRTQQERPISSLAYANGFGFLMRFSFCIFLVKTMCFGRQHAKPQRNKTSISKSRAMVATPINCKHSYQHPQQQFNKNNNNNTNPPNKKPPNPQPINQCYQPQDELKKKTTAKPNQK